jgi:hypothetical protein
MSHVNPTDPSQVSYPWRATLRTASAYLLAALIAVGAALPLVQEFVAQFWPDSPIVAVVGTVSAIALALASLITRIMALESVNNFLTRIGFGATPR